MSCQGVNNKCNQMTIIVPTKPILCCSLGIQYMIFWGWWKKVKKPWIVIPNFYFSGLNTVFTDIAQLTDFFFMKISVFRQYGQYCGTLWYSGKQSIFKQCLKKNDSVSLGQDIEGYQPLWFEKRTDDATGENIFVYRGGYWEAKDRQDWTQCPEIF